MRKQLFIKDYYKADIKSLLLASSLPVKKVILKLKLWHKIYTTQLFQ